MFNIPIHCVQYTQHECSGRFKVGCKRCPGGAWKLELRQRRLEHGRRPHFRASKLFLRVRRFFLSANLTVGIVGSWIDYTLLACYSASFFVSGDEAPYRPLSNFAEMNQPEDLKHRFNWAVGYSHVKPFSCEPCLPLRNDIVLWRSTRGIWRQTWRPSPGFQGKILGKPKQGLHNAHQACLHARSLPVTTTVNIKTSHGNRQRRTQN